MNRLFLYILNFLPIIIIFLLASYTTSFAIISNTILGKLFAVILILFYIKHDKLIGLFVCLLVVFYYQTDFVNYINMLNNPIDVLPATSRLSPKELDEPIFETMETLSDSGLSIDDAYTVPIYTDAVGSQDQRKTEFRKQYCKKGHLIHKGLHITNENAEHIFPDIKHTGEYHKCNLCDNTCDFSFVNNKLEMEEILVKPKNSNDWVAYVWESMINLQTK